MTMPHYALSADRIWDGFSDTARVGAAVIVRGTQIEDIRPVEELPPELPRLGWPGCTLIPGLIDAHVHYSAAMGPAFLAAGVTTVRDVGNDLEWILEQRGRNAAHSTEGPAIVCCGALLEGPNAYWKRIGRGHAGTEELRTSIGHHVSWRVDQIKLYDSLTPGMFQAGLGEAQRAGKHVLAHLGQVSAEDAARAGLSEIEHLSKCTAAWKPATRTEVDDLIGLLIENGVVLTPTLIVWDRLGRILDRALHHDQRRQWAHPSHLEIWNRYLSRSAPPEDRLGYQEAMPRLKRFLLRAHAGGVVIGLGTDTPFPHLVPGFSVHDELAMYVDAGIAPVDALRAATSVNARVLGIEAHGGRIAAGLDADLVAIRGNPLECIDDISNVTRVIRAGQVIEPEAMMGAVQASFTQPLDDPITNDLWDYVHRRLHPQ